MDLPERQERLYKGFTMVAYYSVREWHGYVKKRRYNTHECESADHVFDRLRREIDLELGK